MRGSEIIDRLKREGVIGDGALGTMFYNSGIDLAVSVESLNLDKPELVKELHGEYSDAGAEVVETNTFGANRIKLERFGLGEMIREINYRGAILARQGIKGAGYVAGSVGPIGKPVGKEPLTNDETFDVFAEQIVALADGGVDFIILETFSDIDEILTALKAAKEKTGIPVICQMAFLEGSKTARGSHAGEVSKKLKKAGADAIGANCGSGPLHMTKVMEVMAASVRLPLSAYPNAGFPRYVDGRNVYLSSPDYMVKMAVEMVEVGVTLVGGCCGTTPDHIRALSERLKSVKARKRGLFQFKKGKEIVPAPEGPVYERRDNFLNKPAGDKVVTVELDPPRGIDYGKVIAGAKVLRAAGADAINLAENPLARIRMSSIALGSIVQNEAGITSIPHITCRDRNTIILQSELMGAWALGIRSILAVTGDPVSIGDLPEASSVFDVNSFGLIKIISDLNSGSNSLDNPIGGSTGFVIGAAFNPNSRNIDGQVKRLKRKIEAGAHFAQTQPVFEKERFKVIRDKTGELPITILPGILPLVSSKNTEFLHNEVPGISIPADIRERMADAGPKQAVKEGVKISKELIDAAWDLFPGFYIIPPFGRYEIALELTGYIREKEKKLEIKDISRPVE